jgi:hypothetical protein
MPSQVLHEFEWEGRGFVRAAIDSFRRKEFASIRLWVEPRDQSGGDLIPTSKGLSIPLEYVPDLLEACQALAAAVPQQTRRVA